jgi:hypothetical protein
MSEDETQADLLQRLDSWLVLDKLNPDRLPLLTHMGMTCDEFIRWRESRYIPEEFL